MVIPIHLRYFASLREKVGTSEETLNIPQETNVAGVRALLLLRYPQLEKALERAVCAVNREYVAPETILQANDEVVFIPPVGGGNLE